MKYFNRFVVRCLLFLYLTSSYLSAIHVHHDALESHNDCKICLFSKNLNSADIPITSSTNLICIFYYQSILFQIEKINNNTLKGFNSNAPPFS